MNEKMTEQKNPAWLFPFSAFLSGATLFLIAAGGLVTSHEAGLAVPDWPLSYGQLMPPMVGNIFWEHGHRMIAGTVGILTLIFAISVQIFESRKWMKRFAWIMLGAVVLQALLGGLTVLLMLPPAVSIFHAALAQTFFSLTVLAAYFLSSASLTPVFPAAEPRAKRLFVFTAGFVFLQLILGGIVRHTTSWHAVYTHVLAAVFVLTHVALGIRRIFRDFHGPALFFRTGAALGILTVIQIFLGIAALIFTRMVERGYSPRAEDIWFATAHQTTGALILALSVLIATMAKRS